MCPHGGDCPATGPKRLSALGSDKSLIPPHLCRSIAVNRGIGGAGLDLGRRINSQVIGASDAAKPAEAGRIDAEWCPTRAMVRRSSWPGRRRRAGGGVMATGHQVVAGAPASAEDAAAGPPVTAEHATRPGAPHGALADGRRPRPGRDGDGTPRPGCVGQDQAGGGGRWLVWVFRVVLWTVLLLIGLPGRCGDRDGVPGTRRNIGGARRLVAGRPVSSPPPSRRLTHLSSGRSTSVSARPRQRSGLAAWPHSCPREATRCSAGTALPRERCSPSRSRGSGSWAPTALSSRCWPG